ncbi:unnamed protein product [Caretta caretta]
MSRHLRPPLTRMSRSEEALAPPGGSTHHHVSMQPGEGGIIRGVGYSLSSCPAPSSPALHGSATPSLLLESQCFLRRSGGIFEIGKRSCDVLSAKQLRWSPIQPESSGDVLRNQE